MRRVSKREMWSEKCDSNLFFAWNCLRRFVFVIMFNHFIVSFSDHLISCLTNNACSFSIIEWRMSVLDLSSDVCLFSICRTTFMMRRRLWNISSNLKKATHQIWRKRLIKFDENNVISSNLTITSFHQTWDRHLIKFLKKQTIFLLSMSDLM